MEQPGPEQPKEGAPMEIGSGSRQSKKTKTIPIEFLDADKGCPKRELKILQLKIAEEDVRCNQEPSDPCNFSLVAEKYFENSRYTKLLFCKIDR